MLDKLAIHLCVKNNIIVRHLFCHRDIHVQYVSLHKSVTVNENLGKEESVMT